MIRYVLLVVVLTAVGVTGWTLGRWVTDQSIVPPGVGEPTITPSATTPAPDRGVDPVVGRPAAPQIIERQTVRDDDDGGDTNITVRPETSDDESGSSSPSVSPSASTPDNNVTDVPLPEPAGQATDTAKRIIEDVTGIVTEQ